MANSGGVTRLVAGLLIGILMGIPLFVPAPVAAAGTTYYVDRSHPSASDSNPGTSALPFLTIQKAANLVQAGDTVIVAPGTYGERVTFAVGHSGTPGNPITFIANPLRSVTMWGFYTRNSNHLQIEGFNITIPSGLTGWTEQFGVFVDSHNVEIVDNYFFDIKAGVIVGMWGPPTAWPRNVTVRGNRAYGVGFGIAINGFDWLVENNEVERLINPGSGDSDYARIFGEGHLIRNNFFYGTRSTEIGLAHVDCFQTFDNNGEYARDIIVDGNTCYAFHQGFMAEAAFHRNSSNITFQNNVFHGTWEDGAAGGSWGLAVNQIPNVNAYNNVFANMVYHGIGYQDGGSGIVRNNIFYNAGSNYWAAQGGTVIAGDHNILFDPARQIDGASYPSDLVNVDPSFTDAAGLDFHLRLGSPAIDAGIPAGEAHDLAGNPRPSGMAWDIGAYEFASGGPSDTTPPTVQITSPRANAVVSGEATITANATDDFQVAWVQFQLDGVDVGAADLTAPYSVSWRTTDVANGAHTLTAVARDAAGHVTTSNAITVTVGNVIPTNWWPETFLGIRTTYLIIGLALAAIVIFVLARLHSRRRRPDPQFDSRT